MMGPTTRFLVACSLAIAPSSAWASSWGGSPSWQDEAPIVSRRSSVSRETRTDLTPFSPGSHNIAVDMGQIFLMGDLTTRYENNLGGRLHYTYGVSDIFGFDASLGYSEHSDGKYSMATALAGLRTNLAWFDRVIPHFVFGLGFYRPTYLDGLVPSSSSPSSSSSSTLGAAQSLMLFGVHLGPGVDLQITKYLFFGAGLTFHNIFGTRITTPTGPASVGGTFTSFLLRAGVSF